jgi:structural maintenance of chromosomes protein 6
MSSLSKRSRTDDNETESEKISESEQEPTKKQARSRQSIQYEEEEDSDDEVDMDLDEEYTASKNKRNAIKKTNQSQKRPRKKAGTNNYNDDNDRDSDSETESDDDINDDDDSRNRVKEAGIILWMDIENFMNHQKLNIKFNNNLNFITGKNGSGKSAIATALMVGLGSKTGSTGRGNLSSMVREGSNSPAKIQICFQNTGPDAFEPEIYGSKIIVERTLRKSPSSSVTTSYRILDSKGNHINKTNPTKEKQLLNRILALFNIHIGNPCCVLTQEESKKFIQGSEKDKYNFFMKATGLEAMFEDIKETTESVTNTEIALDRSKLSIQAMKTEMNEKKAIRNQIYELSTIDEKINLCYAKAAWVDVEDASNLYEQFQIKVNDASKDTKKALNDVEKQEITMSDNSDLESTTKEIAEIAKEYDNIEKETTLHQAAHKDKSKKLTSLKNKITETKNSITQYNQQLQTAQNNLNDIRSKAIEIAPEYEADIINKIKQCDIDINKYKKQDIDNISIKFNIQNKISDIDDEMKLWTRNQRNINNELKNLTDNLNSIKNNKDIIMNTLMALGGQDMIKAYKCINNVPSLRNVVIGPIGSLVKLKGGNDSEFKQYEKAIEQSINTISTAFINTSNNMKITNQVLEIFKSNNIRYDIYNQPISEKYNFRNINEAKTVLDSLEIDIDDTDKDTNPLSLSAQKQIYNCIIDRSGIEKRILIPDENDATTYIRNHNGKDYHINPDIKDMICKNGTIVYWRDGYRASNPQKNQNFKHYLGKDANEVLNSKENEIINIKEQYNMIMKSKPNITEMKIQYNNEIKSSSLLSNQYNNKIKECMKYKKKLENELTELKDIENLDTTEYENEVNDLNENIINSSKLLQDMELKLINITNECNILKDTKDKYEKKKKI